MSENNDNNNNRSGSSKKISFGRGVAVNAGDVIAGNLVAGYHVVLKYHILGSTPYPEGYSDDFVHWSVGRS